MLKMKIRDDILLVEQGMWSVSAASADSWGVAYHEVPDAHPPDRKIAVVAVHTGLLVRRCAVFL